MTPTAEQQQRLNACLDLLRRSGAGEVQIRWSGREDGDADADQEEPTPVVWLVVAIYGDQWEAAAGRDPLTAAVRLLETTLDGGGYCLHCRRPTGVNVDWANEMPLGKHICWYVYDPETHSFRRSCEGDTTTKVGRNDPCPCGSGQKFKRCHGANLR